MKRNLTLAGALLLSAVAQAAPITPGNLLIYRVGDGSAALSAAATAVYLDEYSPLGTLVQSFALPSSGETALTAAGNASTEGIMSLAQNGGTVLFGGYRANAGTASVSGTAPATVNRVIGTFSPLLGTFATAIALTDSTATIRSVTSTDASSAFYVGTSAGVRYVGSPSSASTSTVIDTRNSRQVLLTGNRLFASNGSTGLTPKVQDYGILPTGPVTSNSVVVLATGDAVNGIAFFDLSASVAGDDTLYALSTVENRLRKYTFDGATWAEDGFLALASTAAAGAQNLDGYVIGGEVELFLTSSSTLSSLSDASGYDGTLSGSFTSLANADSNKGFRGIAVLVPEPTTAALLGLGIAAFALRRRA